MKQLLEQMSREIAHFLKEWLVEHRGYACRTFYGEAFTLALFSKLGMLNAELKEILLKNLNKSDYQSHWEFNRYALEEYGDVCVQGSFKGTQCTNWTLLRNLLEYNRDEVKKLLKNRQLPNGLIMDDPGVYSFQYHCFSLALLIEMHEKYRDDFLHDAFERGVDFIRSMILSDGDTLYIGRGQQQIFGYASLIYVLSKSKSPELEKVTRYIKSFQRDDGSLPLVLRHGETEIPAKVDLKDPKFSGWYGYNNYFDYLPFAGFFLAKASEAFKDVQIKSERAPQSSFDGYFQKVVTPCYQAVLAKPTGYFTNDMPFPYLESLTPCYGGEQFEESLFAPKDLPLPYFPKWNRTIRWKSRTLFQPGRMITVSPLGVMVRRFSFKEDEIGVKTIVFTPYHVEHQYLVLDSTTQSDPYTLKDQNLLIQGNKPFKYQRDAYSASGSLKLFSSRSKSHQIKLKVLP